MKTKKTLQHIAAVAVVLLTLCLVFMMPVGAVNVATYEELAQALSGTDKTVTLNADIQLDTKITVPDSFTIDLNGKTLTIAVENSYYNDVTIENGNIILVADDVHVCDGYFLVNEGKTLTLTDVKISGNNFKTYAVFHLKTGAAITLTDCDINLNNNQYEKVYIIYAGEGTAQADISSSDITGISVSGIVHAATTIEDSNVALIGEGKEHGFNRGALTIDDSTVVISGGTGRGITPENGPLVISGNSQVTISDMGEATIEMRTNEGSTIASTASVTLDKAITKTSDAIDISNLVSSTSVVTSIPPYSGSGTETDPYLIKDAIDLVEFAVHVNSANHQSDEYFKLGDSITLTSAWTTPIGDGTRSGNTYTGYAFKGVFDGNGKTISGLKIDTLDNADKGAGLFGIVDGGTITNLILSDVLIAPVNGDNVGAAVGVMVNGATVEKVTVKSGSISGEDGVGGIVGRMIIDGTIEDCINHASVTATESTCGGIVGKAYYTNTGKEMSITKCTNNGYINAGYAAGGITGLSAAKISSCTNNGEISAGTSTGGIVGEQIMYGAVSENINTASISGNSITGGIIGWIRYHETATNYPLSDTISVTKNTNSGSISTTGSSNLGSGGIIGRLYDKADVSENIVTAESISGTNAAGIVGSAYVNPHVDGAISINNNIVYSVLTSPVAKFVNPETLTGMTVSGNIYMPECVASVGNNYYSSLSDAVDAAGSNDVVKLIKNTEGPGVVINNDVTIDFNGFTYSFTSGVGSTGTESNGFQILKENTVTLKNGTLNVADSAKSNFYILVQNYASLTVEDMVLDGTNLDKYSTTDGDSYTLSINSGTVTITGDTDIIANDEGDLAYAFDVCDYSNYANPEVTVSTTGKITGNIEISEGLDNNLKITSGTFTVDVSEYTEDGYFAEQNEDGEYVVKEETYIPPSSGSPTSPGSSSSGSSSGDFQYYPRSVPADGVIDFGTSPVVTGMEVPVGSSGTVTLNTKPTFAMPENGFYIFEIDAPGYNTEAKINGGIAFKISLAKIEEAGWTENDVVLFHGTVAEDGKITWEALTTNLVKVENGIAYYKAAINGCSPFYIGFVEDGSIVNTEVVDPVTPPTDEPQDVPGEVLPEIPPVDEPETPASPAPILAVLAGLGAAVVLRRK